MRPHAISSDNGRRIRCEYCLLPQHRSELTHHIEHIITKQHGAADEADNLAFACHRCNLHKGPNVTGIDPDSGNIVALFHPRRDEWSGHFRFRGPYIEGVTPNGRATVRLWQSDLVDE